MRWWWFNEKEIYIGSVWLECWSQSNVHCYICDILSIDKVNCDSTLKINFSVHNCANLEVKVTSHGLMKSGCKLFCKYCFQACNLLFWNLWLDSRLILHSELILCETASRLSRKHLVYIIASDLQIICKLQSEIFVE